MHLTNQEAIRWLYWKEWNSQLAHLVDEALGEAIWISVIDTHDTQRPGPPCRKTWNVPCNVNCHIFLIRLTPNFLVRVELELEWQMARTSDKEETGKPQGEICTNNSSQWWTYRAYFLNLPSASEITKSTRTSARWFLKKRSQARQWGTRLPVLAVTCWKISTV